MKGESAMDRVGAVAIAIAAVIGGVLTVVGVRSIPDIRRYFRIRNM
ncbi:hypothetical protein FB390_5009 [Nocardia bhagyanarayanae]|uniref:Uncharacterized protein n=1 Tax=Nocardia bhagyanarayanae TaxID=1215925 RepID=A0A543FHN0_9NOCA|nr:hypothetical protein FB390_5009 [Nocardia bhagyanarayanae]